MTAEEKRGKKCSYCDEPAVIRLHLPDRYLCSSHLVSHIRGSVAQTIDRNHLLAPGDRVGVALSGGKDSTALLLLLHHLMPRYPEISLHAITIDEGIAGYRDETVGQARSLTKQLGLDLTIISFSAMFGRDLDTFLAGREKEACTVCGVLRRRALIAGAQQVGATAIATGHNLDDEAQSVLMNVLRGDLPRLVQDTAVGSPGCFLPRIKPLACISEKEIATFLFVQGYFSDLPVCPYARYALRAEVRSILSDLEYAYPGTMKRLIRSRNLIRGRVSPAGNASRLQFCRECGSPCSGGLCQVCRLITVPPG